MISSIAITYDSSLDSLNRCHDDSMGTWFLEAHCWPRDKTPLFAILSMFYFAQTHLHFYVYILYTYCIKRGLNFKNCCKGAKGLGSKHSTKDNCLTLERVKTFPYFYLYCILFVINLHVHNIEIISCFATCNGVALVFLTLSNCPDNGFINPGRRPD